MSRIISDSMTKLDISELRRNYTKSGLVESDLPDEPMQLFRLWVRQSVESEVLEPNAMSLATVGKTGTPDVRMVLMKAIKGESITFFTNYNSNKAKDLENNHYASCCFWWPELERQVRLQGVTEKVSHKDSKKYFSSRPRASQIGAWASDQSSSVKDRQELEYRFREFETKFSGKEVPLPGHWGGFLIKINVIEFWQGRKSRLHDRIEYTRTSRTSWERKRLAP